MRQSLCPLARPGERLQPLIRSFHLYHNRPINKTTKFGRERETVCEAKDSARPLQRSPFGAAGRSRPHPGRVHSMEFTLRAASTISLRNAYWNFYTQYRPAFTTASFWKALRPLMIILKLKFIYHIFDHGGLVDDSTDLTYQFQPLPCWRLIQASARRMTCKVILSEIELLIILIQSEMQLTCPVIKQCVDRKW